MKKLTLFLHRLQIYKLHNIIESKSVKVIKYTENMSVLGSHFLQMVGSWVSMWKDVLCRYLYSCSILYFSVVVYTALATQRQDTELDGLIWPIMAVFMYGLQFTTVFQHFNFWKLLQFLPFKIAMGCICLFNFQVNVGVKLMSLLYLTYYRISIITLYW